MDEVEIRGRANQTFKDPEIFADFGATSVLEGLGYYGFSDDGETKEMIGWNYDYGPHIALVREAMRTYFHLLFNPTED